MTLINFYYDAVSSFFISVLVPPLLTRDLATMQVSPWAYFAYEVLVKRYAPIWNIKVDLFPTSLVGVMVRAPTLVKKSRKALMRLLKRENRSVRAISRPCRWPTRVNTWSSTPFAPPSASA